MAHTLEQLKKQFSRAIPIAENKNYDTAIQILDTVVTNTLETIREYNVAEIPNELLKLLKDTKELKKYYLAQKKEIESEHEEVKQKASLLRHQSFLREVHQDIRTKRYEAYKTKTFITVN